MGQGYSITTLSAGSAGIDVPELADLSYEKALGDARFMKAIRAKHRDGLVVAKVVMKPYSSLRFATYIEAIMKERQKLANVPNALGYHRAFETSSNGYLVRQYVYSSIYDRLSTRPFLEDIEKKWLAFQLLCAVRDCHAQELYHGDIKTENVLVTSWNWLYLADFSSSFKPTYLPEDNPADFSFFFDISGRRTCYLAPERFSNPSEHGRNTGITWAMDIFSVGCVIAELFLETPIFSLSQLFKYRKGEYDPLQTHLSRIEDPDIRELVSHMIQVEPESRYSADEYLNFWRQKAFPDYFYSFLHQYMHLCTDPSSGRSPITATGANLGESDERIDRVYHDFDKISYFLGWPDVQDDAPTNNSGKRLNQLFPLFLDLPEKREIVSEQRAPTTNDGSLLFLSIVTSALRSTARSAARVRACELLLAFGQRITHEAKLDRVLPYVMTMIHDPSDLCKVAAMRTLTQLLAIIPSTSPANAYIFPEYILPRLEALTLGAKYRPTPLIRATYATCLATLAESASRFLDIVQALRSEDALPPVDGELEDPTAYAYRNMYDDARADLVRFFETETKALLTDTDADVRRAFLISVSSLCVFFGTAKANDVILSHLNTYLNDKDWKLKSAFFETIVGVATYVGGTNLEEFILPLMIQALTDTEECVVEKVLRSLATMAQLGLFQKSRSWALIDLVARFTMHPNMWIREAAAQFISGVTKYLSVADFECVVKPLISPYLRITLKSYKELDILDSLKKPLPRNVLELVMTWVSKIDKGIFWKSAQHKLASFLLEDRMPALPDADLRPNALSRAQKNEEDNQWISKLRNAGMTAEDDMKFMALHAYLWRVSQRKTRELTAKSRSKFDERVGLSDVNVEVQTVFFEQQPEQSRRTEKSGREGQLKRQTIADALNEASSPLRASSHRNSTDSSLHGSISASPRAALTFLEPDKPSRERILHQKASRGSVDTSDTASILSSDETLGHLRHNHVVSRKGSAMSLMQRSTANAKAIAETSTTDTNAQGEVVDPSNVRSSSLNASLLDVDSHTPKAAIPRYREAHSYTGRDPSVLKHLDTHYMTTFPSDSAEFGAQIMPIQHRRRLLSKPAFGGESNYAHPRGTLVAMFGEHTGPVRIVVVAPDHRFFITGSDDGSVRVWDCTRLERNLAQRSRQVYKHALDAKVTSLCFLEECHCFATAGSDGSLHIVKVDVIETTQGTVRYGKLKVLRTWQLPTEDSHVTWSEHYKTEDQSILILATNTSQVYALDLKTMEKLYVLENPVQHGTLTCFCLDSQKHLLLLGTSHGVLDLWDLRFRLRLRSWGFPGKSAINRILLHPSCIEHTSDERNQHEPVTLTVCIAGGTNTSDITFWNLNTATCDLAFHSTNVDQAIAAPFIDRSAASRTFTLERLDTLPSTAFSNQSATSSTTTPTADAPSSDIRALTLGLSLHISDPNNPTNTAKKSDPYLISTGPDRRVRYWNLTNPARSRVISGLAPDELQPQFVAIEPTTMTSAKVWEEKRRLTANDDEAAPPKQLASRVVNTQTTPVAETAVSSEGQRRANVGARRSGEASVPTVQRTDTNRTGKGDKTKAISEHQQLLLRNHLDAILDVAVVEWPVRMVVSVDRNGMVYVFS